MTGPFINPLPGYVEGKARNIKRLKARRDRQSYRVFDYMLCLARVEIFATGDEGRQALGHKGKVDRPNSCYRPSAR